MSQVSLNLSQAQKTPKSISPEVARLLNDQYSRRCNVQAQKRVATQPEQLSTVASSQSAQYAKSVWFVQLLVYEAEAVRFYK